MTTTPLGNRDLIRALNRSIILNTIKTNGPIDRAEIARRTSLSPATVTGITAELIAEDLIFEKEPGDSRGGRRPILLAINPLGAYVVGVKLTETHALGALTDLEASVVAKSEALLPDRRPESAIRIIAELVASLLGEAGIPQHKLIGVGVGLAGIVDFRRGLLRQSPFFGWRNLPVRDLLQEQIHAPVYVDNDVNTLTLAELWFGYGQGAENFLTLTIGRGVGLGLVTNRQFYRGSGGGAGEFGHTVVDPHGPLCDCGKRGCLEAYVGDPALLRQAQAAFERGELPHMVHSIAELAQLAQSGVPAARRILAEAGEVLGRAVSNLINIFNPQRILVSGEGAACLGPVFFDAFGVSVQQNSLPDLYQDAEIKIEPWGDDVWARGAASLVLRSLFESPVHEGPTGH